MTTMVKIVTGFTKYSDEELNAHAQIIIASMTDNPHYPTPVPALPSIMTALTDFQEALVQAGTGGLGKTAAKNNRRKALMILLNLLALHVQANCKDDLEILQSSGFHARRPASPTSIAVLDKPTNMKIVPGPNPGSVEISIDKIEAAESYIYEFTVAPISSTSQWLHRSTVARNCIINDLISGQQYAFRVAGVGKNPTMAYSDIVNSYIL